MVLVLLPWVCYMPMLVFGIMLTVLLQKINSFPSAYSKQLALVYDGSLKDQALAVEKKLLRTRKLFHHGGSNAHDYAQTFCKYSWQLDQH